MIPRYNDLPSSANDSMHALNLNDYKRLKSTHDNPSYASASMLTRHHVICEHSSTFIPFRLRQALQRSHNIFFSAKTPNLSHDPVFNECPNALRTWRHQRTLRLYRDIGSSANNPKLSLHPVVCKRSNAITTCRCLWTVQYYHDSRSSANAPTLLRLHAVCQRSDAMTTSYGLRICECSEHITVSHNLRTLQHYHYIFPSAIYRTLPLHLFGCERFNALKHSVVCERSKAFKTSWRLQALHRYHDFPSFVNVRTLSQHSVVSLPQKLQRRSNYIVITTLILSEKQMYLVMSSESKVQDQIFQKSVHVIVDSKIKQLFPNKCGLDDLLLCSFKNYVCNKTILIITENRIAKRVEEAATSHQMKRKFGFHFNEGLTLLMELTRTLEKFHELRETNRKSTFARNINSNLSGCNWTSGQASFDESVTSRGSYTPKNYDEDPEFQESCLFTPKTS